MVTKIGLKLYKLLGRLPFSVLYFISNILYVLVYKIVGYRKKVVRENLELSFPEKDEKSIKAIEKKFYKHLFDIMVETLKCESITEEDLALRMKPESLDIINDLKSKNQSAMIITGHYNNWEWSGRKFIIDSEGMAIIAYKKVTNPNVDELILESRKRFGGHVVSMMQFIRYVIKRRKETLFPVLIADQTPHKDKIEYVTNFLNQDTAVYLGGENLAKSLKLPVYFMSVHKIKRGYYSYRLELITEDYNAPKFEITNKHLSLLENQIKENPAYWLWSHRRWKYTRK